MEKHSKSVKSEDSEKACCEGKDKWFLASIALLIVLSLSIAGNFLLLNRLSSYVGPAPVKFTGTAASGSLGNPDAKVTLTMYTDFQCPYCARWYFDTFAQVKANFIDTGLVKFEVRNFPLSFHANAMDAANAAECAKEQGHFLDYEEKLYANQQALSKASLVSFAGELGMNEAAFSSCLDSAKYQDKVDQDQQDAAAAGISGTPGFLINGKEFPVGASPYSVFEAELNKQLGN